MYIRVIRVKQYKKGITLYKNNALGLCKTYDGFNIEDIKRVTIDNLKVSDICTFSSCDDTITIYAIKR